MTADSSPSADQRRVSIGGNAAQSPIITGDHNIVGNDHQVGGIRANMIEAEHVEVTDILIRAADAARAAGRVGLEIIQLAPVAATLKPTVGRLFGG